MKKSLIYILACSLSLFVSCTDFLDSEPITDMTDANFYKTVADANKAIVGCYDGLQRNWNDGVAFPVLSEIAADNCFGATGNGDGLAYQAIEEFDLSRSPADNDMFNGNWKNFYKSIYRCNVLLSKMDQIAWGSDTKTKLTIECEARFLRAFMYFDMVRLWGDIPLVTVPTAESLPRSPADEVYKLIATDLKYVADNMESEAYSVAWAKTNDGRVTKWAAKALLARVYLFYTGYYAKPDLVGVVTKAEALASLEDVITNGGYSLLPDFARLFPAPAAYQRIKEGAGSTMEYAGKGNSETVFAVKYNLTSNYDGKADGNQWLVMLGMRSVTSYPYSTGWGACTVDARFWNSFSDVDTRKTASIIAYDEEKVVANIDDQREYTGYNNKKYTPVSVLVDGVAIDESVHLGALNFQIGQFQDYVSIRLADVYLMAAELGSAKAQDYFDLVRKRAYKENFTAIPPTVENILQERNFELAFEGIRYWDVLRQGVAKAATILARSTMVSNGGTMVLKEIKAANFLKTKGLQQIPNDQISKSKGQLIQNPGWE